MDSKTPRNIVLTIYLLWCGLSFGQNSMPILNGILQNDFNACGFHMNNINLAPYAGAGLVWNGTQLTASGSSGPGGANTTLQQNSSGVFGGTNIFIDAAGTTRYEFDNNGPTQLQVINGTSNGSAFSRLLVEPDTGHFLAIDDYSTAYSLAPAIVQGGDAAVKSDQSLNILAGAVTNDPIRFSSDGGATQKAQILLGLSVGTSVDGGAGVVNVNTGYQIGNAAPVGHYLRGNGTDYVDSTIQAGDLSSFGANPTAQVGLTAVNGSASTLIRSDGAPALSQSIAPTWTAIHQWLQAPAANTNADAVQLYDTTSATVGNQQFSPSLHFQGQGWKTTATAASEAVDYRIYLKPIQGTTTPTGQLNIDSSINGGSFGNPFAFKTDGTVLSSVAGTASNPSYQLPGGNTGMHGPAGNVFLCATGNDILLASNATPAGVQLESNSYQYGWGSGAANDTALARNAAGVVEADNGTSGQWAQLKAGIHDAGTNTVTNGLVLGHQSTGAITNGLGTAIQYNIDDSTTGDTSAGQEQVLWTTNTHGSNVSDYVLLLDNGSATPTERFRVKGGGGLVLNGAVVGTGPFLQGNGSVYTASTWALPSTGGTTDYTLTSSGTNGRWYPTGLINSDTATFSASFASDTYVSNSNVTVNAGDFKQSGVYHFYFDMTKTAAGTATPIITVRAGTTGTVSDAALCTLTFTAGTTTADSGIFEGRVVFRSVGSGTAAVVNATATCVHKAGAGGLISNTGGYAQATSAGFDSTTPTQLGVSFNGGASFSGTLTQAEGDLMQP